LTRIPCYVLGIYTGSIYQDTALIKDGFLGEDHIKPNVVVIKTHENWNCTMVGKKFKCPIYEKAILIVRDPHQTILAE